MQERQRLRIFTRVRLIKNANVLFLHKVWYPSMPSKLHSYVVGECSNPECMYRHVDPEENRKECPWYARGFCKHGPKCRNKHVKKKKCPNYMAGFCPEGPKCKYGQYALISYARRCSWALVLNMSSQKMIWIQLKELEPQWSATSAEQLGTKRQRVKDLSERREITDLHQDRLRLLLAISAIKRGTMLTG